MHKCVFAIYTLIKERIRFTGTVGGLDWVWDCNNISDMVASQILNPLSPVNMVKRQKDPSQDVWFNNSRICPASSSSDQVTFRCCSRPTGPNSSFRQGPTLWFIVPECPNEGGVVFHPPLGTSYGFKFRICETTSKQILVLQYDSCWMCAL